METFTLNQRIKITAGEFVPDISGRTGTVERIRKHDRGAYVRMDQDLPDDHRKFGREDERRNDLLLFPEECEAEC